MLYQFFIEGIVCLVTRREDEVGGQVRELKEWEKGDEEGPSIWVR